MTSLRDSRGARLLAAVVLAWVGLVLCAQAANATYGRVTVVKVNNGGPKADTFGFTPTVAPAQAPFTLAGGQSKTFDVECNVDRLFHKGECKRWGYPALSVDEDETPGYALSNVECRSRKDGRTWNTAPTKYDPVENVGWSAGSTTLNFKVAYGEWIKCWVTNTPKPGIDIEKTGPATAEAGSVVPYTLDVSNTGKTVFAEAKVAVTDDRCDAAPALSSKNDDATPATLDPGDHWTYTCSVTTKVGDTEVVNTGAVTGTDTCGRKVSDESTVTTTLTQPAPPNPNPNPNPTPTPTPTPVTPVSPVTPVTTPTSNTGSSQSTSTEVPKKVSPARSTPGTAKLRGPAGCPTSAVAATVSGKRIVKVTFLVDGKKVKTLTKANKSGGRWVLPLDVRHYAVGKHRIEARVQFAKSSATKAKTLRFTFKRCGLSVVPRFTG